LTGKLATNKNDNTLEYKNASLAQLRVRCDDDNQSWYKRGNIFWYQ